MVVGSHGEQLSCPWRDAAALFFPISLCSLGRQQTLTWSSSIPAGSTASVVFHPWREILPWPSSLHGAISPSRLPLPPPLFLPQVRRPLPLLSRAQASFSRPCSPLAGSAPSSSRELAVAHGWPPLHSDRHPLQLPLVGAQQQHISLPFPCSCRGRATIFPSRNPLFIHCFSA